MPLRTFVKVSGVLNLSDARYCAGMGVDLLGFGAVEGQEAFIKPAQFQDIRGWVTGPQIVAEAYGIKSPAEMDYILENYKPDYIEMGMRELSLFSSLPLPVIISVESAAELEIIPFSPAFIISNSRMHSTTPLLVRVESRAETERLLADPGIKGIVLKGGTEEKPGLKKYEMIDEVLEFLEIEE
jgi:phosphoribosylanthranilate isomerase